MKKLILASASPRRRELLEQLGYSFSLLPVDINETPLKDELPQQYLPRMSTCKAAHAWKALSENGKANENVLILASDTSVIVNDQIMGKPKDKDDFVAMMLSLSDQWHEVMTSIALLTCDSDENIQQQEETVVTRVKFKALSPFEIDAYWKTGEPQDKAGGYGIQGKGAVFVEGLEGSYSNVVGLPLQETANLLNTQGIDICKIWLEP